jgi:hypothetical protein
VRIDELEAVCTAYEEEHGIDAFLNAMAAIMQRRMARQGLKLEFFDDEEDVSSGE